MDKAPDAFRTISEVADDLDVPQHVLRFWETRFAQIRPMKRSGGRRFYRPDDVYLLRGIRRLLYGEGYTIRGVQKILKEHGVKAVQAFADGNALSPLQAEKVEPEPRSPEPDPDKRPDQKALAPDFEPMDDDEDDLAPSQDDDPDEDDEGAEFSEPSPAAKPFVAPQKPAAPVADGPVHQAREHYRDSSLRASQQEPAQERALDVQARARLNAALQELMICRELIDKALKEHPGAPIPEI